MAFSSPPYLNAVNYSQHVDKIKGKVQRWERTEISCLEYKNFLVDRFATLHRIVIRAVLTLWISHPWRGAESASHCLSISLDGWKKSPGNSARILLRRKQLRVPYVQGVYWGPLPRIQLSQSSRRRRSRFSETRLKKGKENIYWNRTNEEKERNKINLDIDPGEMIKNVWKIRLLSPQ